MWTSLAILVNFFLLLTAQKAEGECIVEGIDLNAQSYRNLGVIDTERIQFGRFQTKNVISVTADGTPDTKYFNVTLNSNKTLIISPTEEFKNYGDNRTHTIDPQISTFLNFICTDDITIIKFLQPVTGDVNRPPYFSKSKYILDMPKSVGRVNLNNLLNEHILACDDDISNTFLWFFADPTPDIISIDVRSPLAQSKRCLEPIYELTHNLNLTEYITITLSVRNRHSVYGKATLILRPWTANPPLPPNPSFENSTYNASYTTNSTLHDVKFNEVIRIQPGFNITNASLVGAYANHFLATPNGNEVQIKLIQNLYDNVLRDLAALNLTLNATVRGLNSSATAKLIINLPQGQSSQNSSAPIIIIVRNSYQQLVDRNLGFTLLINEIQVDSTNREVIVVIPVHGAVHVYGLEDFPWASISVKTVNRPGNLTEVRFLYYTGIWNLKQPLLA